jgi:very-short-patch-repair endonuclease
MSQAQPYRHRRSFARNESRITKARELRSKETESEETAWRLLRTLRLNGFKFRRQHPVDRYIVDFCCAQRRLIVELDGGAHSQPSQVRRDTARDVRLKRIGYTVTRFPNGMVLEAPELFVKKVRDLAWTLPNVFTGQL